jgi:translation initiation factor IF-3
LIGALPCRRAPRILRHVENGTDFDYAKRAFEQKRAAKAALRRAREQQPTTKAVRLRVGISEHDFDVSVARARRLLVASADVRVRITSQGLRQDALAEVLLSRFITALEDVSMGFTSEPRRGRELSAIVWSR